MPKAVISNRIYLDAEPDLIKSFDEELTYVLPSYKVGEPPQVMKTLRRIKRNLVSLPIGRLDLIPEGYEIFDKRNLVPTKFPEAKGIILRPAQQHIYDEIDDNALINAKPSWGKTFTGIAIAEKLGQKTLVVVHTIAIRSTWVKEYKNFYGIEPGIIGSGKFNLDAPLVVGNIQTIYNNIPKVAQEFGTMIVDEVHRVPSNTFSKIVDTNYARYKIGLSGTLERKDGKHVVLRDYFGNTVFKPPKENQMDPTVTIIKTDIRFMEGARIPWAIRVNDLSNNNEYRHLISMLSAAYAAKGHKVLVVGDRVHFLKTCAELAGEKAISITGEDEIAERDKLEQRLINNEINQIFGTGKIFSEGISIPPLSCLILAFPLNNMPLLEQLIGRIQRELKGKLTPVLVDINLKGGTVQRQASNRLGHYIKQGYKVTTVQA